jgi:mannose-1-phosphate guanylyltransferase/mannose-6-phosphate isomerase
MLSITPVVLSGGSGSRLWPSSRSLYPKQFLKLVSENTMLQETVLRLCGLPDLSAPIVVANNEHRFLVAEQLKACEVDAGSIILEPVGRNTAPAIALAAIALGAAEDTVMLVLPADHIVDDQDAFYAAIELGRIQAENGKLVTFGIVPSSPQTGYGYIHAGQEHEKGVFAVHSFVEKPDFSTAEGYLKDGSYSWNSGIFMFKPSVYLQELNSNQPEIVKACENALSAANDDLDFVRVDEASFQECPSDSIDYAVMEHTNNAVVIPMSVGWNDIGSWSALWEQLDKDESGNVLKGDVMVDGVSNSLIISDKKLIACVGVEDVILVETDDSILLVNKDRVQDVKSVVNRLIEAKRPESQLHRKVYRPWGFYDSIENAEGFQVKRLVVYPGAQLSLQMHHHRAEHWVVVKGTAEVVNGDKTMLLRVNESTYIPIGAQHQLSNPGKLRLELIEVQSGDYLGEDDIVRFEDIYGRI